ncbi:hypothetical protein GGR52DRAFT_576619 [Hypoxylon sp. FL1284]|nr:hypothetical protein GGR52DRAFT_576619 [Hypoxylon sp. FL1284]
MADPFTVFGLIAGIANLIDFGVELVSAGRSLHASSVGTATEIHQLSLIVQGIRRKNGRLWQTHETRSRKLCDDEMAAIALATESDGVAADLEKMLNRLKVRDGRPMIIEVPRIVIGQWLKKKEVVELRQRLLMLDDRVRNNIKSAIQGEQHLAFLAETRALNIFKEELSINFSSRMDHIQEDIQRLINKSSDRDARAAQLTSFVTGLEVLVREHDERRRQVNIIKSLYFAELHRRWSRIEDADLLTNSWLFDESQTSFLDWLRCGEGMFYINGKPGSGKSTLMKFACKHSKTIQALEQWAGTAKLHTASYFFWNQGFEMQKSKTGLLQSLLYQILSRAPDSIPQMCYDHPADEPWEFDTLKTAFQSDTERDDVPEKFRRTEYSLAVQDFTRGDMIDCVRQRLHSSPKFEALKDRGTLYGEIIEFITDNAQGVWLWVFLVTRDLIKAVNRDEGSRKLTQIINEFPKDLESYFEAIVNRIEPHYRREMAQILLLALEQVQPLPLYAFSLLEVENQDPRYAISAPVSPITHQELLSVETPWMSRLFNRCGDLLLVSHGDHPIFLRNSVDFMHRTVRDFLQDCFYQRLQSELRDRNYSPSLSLCNISLFLLKKLSYIDLSTHDLRKASMRQMIERMDELFYYAHEQEKLGESSELVDILDEADRVSSIHEDNIYNYWILAGDLPTDGHFEKCPEEGNCNFLALTVQARLVNYVREKLRADRRKIQKRGRPLLDYALRPRRVTMINMPYYSDRNDPSVDVNMVKLLLDYGANPNQQMHLNNGHTVWALFLQSMWEKTNDPHSPLGRSNGQKRAWYAVSELLIQHGADIDCRLGSFSFTGKLTAASVLERVFGNERAAKLIDQMRATQAQNVRGSWFSGFRLPQFLWEGSHP